MNPPMGKDLWSEFPILIGSPLIFSVSIVKNSPKLHIIIYVVHILYNTRNKGSKG